MAVQLNFALIGLACGLRQRFAFGDQDLGLNDVDPCDFFGHSVFDLNARVHFDKVELTGVHIHQEFDRARAFVVHMGTDFAAKLTDFCALFLGQVRCGRAFHDFLVAALDRAVTFIKVIDLTMLVTEDLHLDMAGAGDHLFQIALAIAKGGLGLATAFQNLFFQLVFRVDWAHAASTAAPAGLQHQRIADFSGFLADRVHVIAQNFRGGDNRHVSGDGNLAGTRFVTKGAHGFGLGADERDAVLHARIHEVRVFRQKPIAGVDRVRATFLGNADDLINA